MDILSALSALDLGDDEHWTKDGLPKTDVVSEAVGETVTRAQITEAAPLFTRENSVLEVAPVEDSNIDPGTDPENQGDGDDDDDDDDDEGDDEAPVLEGRLGKEHPEVVATGKALEEAAKDVKTSQENFKKASTAHEKAVQTHAPLTHTPEQNQRGIIGIIEAGMKRKEAKFASAQATDAALKSIANPIDTANAKKPDNGRGNAHSQNLSGRMGQSGNQ